ncbi:MAG: tripartite tricarboxylate transporter TctB family protein [Acidobacteria bacterium]|nr:tripartite tricarboxylate transporter TctB family protein [Acidobacteriota bacterium]
MTGNKTAGWRLVTRDLEFWVQVSLVVFFGAFAWVARSFPGRSRLMPEFVSLGSIFLSLISLGVYLSRARQRPAEVPSPSPNRRNLLNIWITSLAGVAATLCGGFLVSVAVYFGLYGLLSWGRSGLLRTIVATTIATALVWYVFGELLQLPLFKTYFF